MSDSRGVMKRCIECHRRMKGDAIKMQWCESCGGEMRTITYRPRPTSRGR